MKIKQDDGTEIEVFTAKEVEEKTKEAEKNAGQKALDEYKAANPDKSGELSDLKTKLQEAEDLLKKAEEGGNAGQIQRLREERDEAKRLKEEGDKNFEKKFDDFRKEMVGDTKEDMLKKLSGTDSELRKKIELEFDNYRPNANGKKDVEERLLKAYQLATGNKPSPTLLDGRTGGGERGDGGGYKPGEKKEYNNNEKAIGRVLGVTEKDRENYEKFEAEQLKKRDAGLIPPK